MEYLDTAFRGGFFYNGKIYVRSKLTAKGEKKQADYILFYKPNIPVAIIKIIPLCHPRQAQRLGASSARWYELHKNWINQKNNVLKPTK